MHDHQDLIGGPHFDRTLIAPNGCMARLHKGGGAPPQPTKAEKERQRKNEEMMLKMMQQSANAKMPEMPAMPAIPPAVDTPPPPSQSSADIEDAQQEAMRQSGRRYGLLKTTYAGNTGGYGGSVPMGGARSLLG
jgi:hypothetical protein